MVPPPLKIGVVDIGTNSVRLLITDGIVESGRWVEVTGLGRGVDRTGELSPKGIEETLGALARFGSAMDRERVELRRAIATSASRDASNREVFFDLAESALGTRPALISGEEEARLAYAGATAKVDAPGPWIVCDIGGGSTELVTESGGISIDIGSVRLTERVVPGRPPSSEEMATARALVQSLLEGIELPSGRLIGVAGTWTSLAAIARRLPSYERELVHGYLMSRDALSDVVDHLSRLTLDQTRAIPSLDPKRAPVILGGALVAETVMTALGAEEVLISEHDTLDGVAMEMLDLA
jgi:exopolyphosphatase/guanosine-5'-triphosphate,3'-diphosphate pyrophosphatase